MNLTPSNLSSALTTFQPWNPHRPGDPMPCDGEALVEVFSTRPEVGKWAAPAKLWSWGIGSVITGWRYANQERTDSQANTERDQPCADVERLQRERDDLKTVIDRQRPWEEKARQLLDVGRWAGRTYLEAAITELEEVRDERDQFRADVAELNERMTTEVKSYLASMEKLRAENNKLRSNPAYTLCSSAPFMEMKLGPVDSYTDEQIQDAIDAAFPSVEGVRYNCLDVLPTSIHWRYESPYRLAIARAFLTHLACVTPENAATLEADGATWFEHVPGDPMPRQQPQESEFEDFERGIITKEGAQ